MTRNLRRISSHAAHMGVRCIPYVLMAWQSSVAAQEATFKDRFEFEVNANASSAKTFYGDFSLTYSPSGPLHESGLKGRGTDRTLDFWRAEGCSWRLVRYGASRPLSDLVMAEPEGYHH